MQDVYATARGPLARVASPLAARSRARRHARFFALAHLAAGDRVLDVGCGPLGLRALESAPQITGTHEREQPAHPAALVPAAAAQGLRFGDRDSDLVYSST